MRKKISTLLFVLIGILLFPNVANAELSCNTTYSIYKDGCAVMDLSGTQYGMNTYSVSNYPYVKAYCVDPVRKSGVGAAGCIRRIDPSSSADGLTYQAYDVAVTKAYQMLTERGRNTTSQTDRILGEVVFRWIGYKYGVMNISSSFGSTSICDTDSRISSSTILALFNPVYYNNYWRNSSYADKELALEIYQASVALGDQIRGGGTTYDQLISNGSLWGDRYTVTSKTQETVGTNVEQITVTLQLENDVQNVYWDEFTGGCDNTGVICTTESVSHSGNTVTVTINVTKQAGYDGQNYNVYVQSSIYDTRSSSSNMLLASPSSWQQQMLLVSDSSSQFVHGGSKVYVETTPGTPDGGRHVCEIIGDQHYCNDGEPCSEPEYRKDCLDDVNCTPTITMPGDCNNFDVESEATGIISDINEVSSSCNPDVDQVKQCVLGHNDLTDTSYESTLELNNNPYCKVYCKESYEFAMPTAKITRSGGYFTLSTAISAERDCYTASADNPTQGIDEAKFVDDLVKLQEEYIRAYDEYLKNKAGAEAWNSVYANRETSGTDGCDGSCVCGYEDGDPIFVNGIHVGNEQGACKGNAPSGCETVYIYTYDFSYTGVEPVVNDSGVNRTVTYRNVPRNEDNDPFGTANNCGCGGECGSDGTSDAENKYQSYVDGMSTAKTKMQNIADEITEKIRLYNDCSGSISNSNISSLATKNPTSKGWNNDMRFDPTVTFNYNQDYMNQMNGTFEQTSVSGPSASTTMYCTGNVDDQYNCLSGGSESITTKPFTITTCNENGCSPVTVTIGSAKWIQKSKTASATYAPNNEFSTYTQYGTIKFKHDACEGNDCLWSNLPEDALPVSLITQTGVFPFVINYTNIGQDNSTGALGRLAGNSTSVLTEYNELDPSVRCTTTDDYLTQDAGYVCHYLTNCNDEEHCDFTCDDENNCEFTEDDCDDDHCTLTCENCIFDGETNNFSYRTITLNNLNPNERSLGFNWSNVKGQATQKAVEDDGETIYETPQYSYTLTPSNLSKIREYNNQAGSYTNAYIPDEYASRVGNTSLSCETMSYNGEDIGLNYNCRSNFLELIEVSGNEFATESYRITSDSEEGTDAFESFSGCSNGYGNGECQYVGPSWRIRTREVS